MNDRGHLTSLSLDRLLLGSLPESEAAEIRAHLQSCDSCRALHTEMEADQQRFRSVVLPRTLAKVEARGAPPTLRAQLTALLKVTTLVVGCGAAAVVTFVVVRAPSNTDGPELAIKGGPSFQVFAARGASVFAVKEGAHLKPGDRIRFVVQRDLADTYVLVASLDGARKVSIYYPVDAAQSAPLGDGRVELPGSIELDDTAGAEQLFAFFSSQPVAIDEVKRSLERWPVPPRIEGHLARLGFEKDPK